MAASIRRTGKSCTGQNGSAVTARFLQMAASELTSSSQIGGIHRARILAQKVVPSDDCAGGRRNPIPGGGPETKRERGAGFPSPQWRMGGDRPFSRSRCVSIAWQRGGPWIPFELHYTSRLTGPFTRIYDCYRDKMGQSITRRAPNISNE